jgi:hypothetical protein
MPLKPYAYKYETRVARWRAGRRFSRLWRAQLRLQQELRRADGSSEADAIRKQIDAVDEQRRMLAYDLGGRFPYSYEQGLIGPV